MAEEKVALITGANRGIGLETARQLGHEGVTVVIGARTLKDAETAATSLTQEGIKAEAVQLDVTRGADRQSAADFLRARFGRLDILVNNAGITGPGGLFGVRAIETSEEELQTVLNTNLFGLIAVTREMLPLLKESDAGRIVNLGSTLGSLTEQADPSSQISACKQFSYNVSKTAVNAFTIHLAVELKESKIKVNTAHPGWVKTELGTDSAPMDVAEGAKTGVALALLGPDGPSGRFMHLGEDVPW